MTLRLNNGQSAGQQCCNSSVVMDLHIMDDIYAERRSTLSERENYFLSVGSLFRFISQIDPHS